MTEPSNILLQKIKEFEGLKLEAYLCPAGVWTIGIGHTKGVKAGQKITEEKALELLKEDLKDPCKFVDTIKYADHELKQTQKDALIDFAYNCGTGALEKSTLLKYIKAGAKDRYIQEEFIKWNKAHGKVLPGLTKRRQWEAYRWIE